MLYIFEGLWLIIYGCMETICQNFLLWRSVIKPKVSLIWFCCDDKHTWRVEEGVAEVFVCSVVGARLTVGRGDSGVWADTVGQTLGQRRHLHLDQRWRHKKIIKDQTVTDQSHLAWPIAQRCSSYILRRLDTTGGASDIPVCWRWMRSREAWRAPRCSHWCSHCGVGWSIWCGRGPQVGRAAGSCCLGEADVCGGTQQRGVWRDTVAHSYQGGAALFSKICTTLTSWQRPHGYYIQHRAGFI